MKQKKRKPTRQRNRAESESKLIQAAKEVFAEYGYDRATTRLVAERAEVNLGLLSRYFGNKHGLLLDVVEHEAEATFSKPLPYPPQKTLLEECLCYAEATFNLRIAHLDLFKIVIVQIITDREFADAIGQMFGERPQQSLKSRVAPFFEKIPNKEKSEKMDKIARFLERTISASILMQFLVSRESKEQCLQDLKEQITIFIKAQQD